MLLTLLEEDVKFLLVGAYALAALGFPRATGDIDIFIQPNKINAEKIYTVLIKFGAPLQNITVEDFSIPGTVFQIGVIPRRIDIINSIDGVTFEDAYKNRVTIDIDSMSIPVLSKDYMIKNKNSTGRPKDKIDAETLENSLNI